MSLSLNLALSGPSKGQLTKHKYADKIAPITDDERFTFSLSKGNTAKGFAVRRKTNPKGGKVNNAVQPKHQTNNVESNAATSSQKIASDLPPKKNYVTAPKQFDSDDEHSDANKDSGIELALNVSEASGDIHQIRKKKLSREQRLNAKRLERRVKLNRVLTKEEIDEGIKKFSNIPQGNPFSQRNKPKKKIGLDIPETKLIGQRAVKPITETIFTGTSVDAIGLHPHSVKNLADLMGITELTTVQLKAIPKALEGYDLLVRSQTGSGKTLAYALPVVQKLQEIRPKLSRTSGIRAVVIVPTRELAIQTYEIFLKLLKPFVWVVAGYLTGGEKRKSEKARLRKGINILVGTPGRLVDHLLHTEFCRLDKTQFLILDEGDRIYEMGYERDVKKIVEGISDHKAGKFPTMVDQQKSKNPFSQSKIEEDAKEETQPVAGEISIVKLQTMLLSATLTPAVQKLAGLALKEPIYIDTSDKEALIPVKSGEHYIPSTKAADDDKLSIPSTVDLSFLAVPPKLRLVTLSSILAEFATKRNLKALVIMATTEMVDYHHSLLMECLTEKVLDDEDEKQESDSEDGEPALLKGVNIFRLHGSMQQTERTGVVSAFRKCKQGVLLATDVAGRGIDIIEVNLVIQYSPPQNIAEFVHRVGRTARAGRSGHAILFVGPSETEFIRKLEEKRIRISQGEIETYLKTLGTADDKAHTTQEAASNLQHKFELLVEDDKEMHEKACKAYVSWVRSYSTFPRELKPIFNLKDAHMGHYAKSFALREPPKSFARKHAAPKPPLPKNRLTYTERDPEKLKLERLEKKRKRDGPAFSNRIPLSEKFTRMLAKNRALNMSEFDSGLPESKKRKRKAKG